MMESETEKTNYLLWLASFLIICGFYVAVGLAFIFFYVPDSRAVGGAEAIMLEFALEAQAPEVEEISEDIREETVAETQEIPESEPVPEPEATIESEPIPEMIEPTPPSDMVEEAKPVEKIEAEPKPEPAPKPKPKPKPKTEKTKPKPAAKKAQKTQKARGPDLAAPQGQKFAAPQTNRNFGNQGKAIAGWKTKVQRRIASRAKSYNQKIRVKAPLTAMVFFRYDAKGKVTAASISRSSGDSAADRIAVQAVQTSSPIPAPSTGQAGSLDVPVCIGC